MRAVVRGHDITEERVAPYLPDHFKTVGTVGPLGAVKGVLIEGEDTPGGGWSFDAYIQPRLASGLMYARRIWSDTEVVDALEDFVRTPDWTVSMLEDIADLVHSARPELIDKEDHDEEGGLAWQRH